MFCYDCLKPKFEEKFKLCYMDTGNFIYNRTRYLLSKKSGIADSINHNFVKIRIDSYNSLPIEEILIFQYFIIFIKSVVNKNKNEYYYNIFLEKGSYKDQSNTQHF